MTITPRIDDHVSDVMPASATGPGAAVGAQAESSRHSAVVKCTWNMGATLTFAAHAILLALSLFLHPLQDCHSVGVLT